MGLTTSDLQALYSRKHAVKTKQTSLFGVLPKMVFVYFASAIQVVIRVGDTGGWTPNNILASDEWNRKLSLDREVCVDFGACVLLFFPGISAPTAATKQSGSPC